MTIGHNSVAGDQLRQYVQRIEKLHDERENLTHHIADVYGELKANGFDKKAVRAIVKLRSRDPNEVAEEEMMIEVYKSALGMLPNFEEACKDAGNKDA